VLVSPALDSSDGPSPARTLDFSEAADTDSPNTSTQTVVIPRVSDPSALQSLGVQEEVSLQSSTSHITPISDEVSTADADRLLHRVAESAPMAITSSLAAVVDDPLSASLLQDTAPVVDIPIRSRLPSTSGTRPTPSRVESASPALSASFTTSSDQRRMQSPATAPSHLFDEDDSPPISRPRFDTHASMITTLSQETNEPDTSLHTAKPSRPYASSATTTPPRGPGSSVHSSASATPARSNRSERYNAQLVDRLLSLCVLSFSEHQCVSRQTFAMCVTILLGLFTGDRNRPQMLENHADVVKVCLVLSNLKCLFG
jgi:hypothetical protein